MIMSVKSFLLSIMGRGLYSQKRLLAANVFYRCGCNNSA